ncbi:little elongation complex subunit 2-like isoform X1 [Zootermopsis nevadensis]|uniref:little elongation complex subunit 2-like isoform X1 n=1 Tax=Zootermopsis nevadensis TaxID=136037 RepID=UPI000B8EE102|nr:little elongation complex subunit 2-like isoform X1 [Zootermopsis nevadensis]
MCTTLQSNKDDFKVEGTGHTESKHNSDFNTIETSDSDDELRFSKTETKESTDGHVNSLKRKHSESCNDSDCESDMSTDTENRLVIDCSDSERNSKTPVGKNKCAQNNNVEDDSRVTRSKARLIEKMSYVNQSLGHKPVQFVTNKEYEIDNKNLREDTCKTFDGNDLEKSLKNVRLSGCFDSKDYTLDSEVANKMSHDTVRPEEEHVESWSINKSTRIDQEFPANEPGSAQKLIDVDAEAQDAMKVAGLNVSTPGFNVSYRLWKLSKDEGHPDDRKEGFLKGNCASHEIKVLVRCKVDGYKINYNKLQRFCVVPKMEYLTEYGAQCFTQSELTQQWISLHVRPGTDLYRVRVNACTSEVIMIERRSLQDVAQETIQQTGRPNSIILGTLYNVLLGLVDLDPGSYILSHTPKLGAFVNLWQSASNGRFKLHDMYKIDPKTTSVSESSLWIPIDHSVVTPFHRACNRVPGTFPPTLFFRGKPVLKKKNKKKKKKQKQKKE